MKRRIVAAVLAVAMSVSAFAFAEAPQQTPVAVNGTAWRNTDIVGSITAEDTFRPQDDFAAAMNKEWFLGATIREGRPEVSTFGLVGDAQEEQMKALVTDETLTGHDAELVRTMYALASDWDARNALGVEPIRPYYDRINAIGSVEELTEYLAGEGADAGLGLYSLTVTPGLDDPERYTVEIDATPLMTTDAADYTGEMSQLGMLYNTLYHEISCYMFIRLGATEQEAESIFQNGRAFETLVADHIIPRAETYMPDYLSRINNNFDREGLAELAGTFPLLAILDGVGFGVSETFLVTEPAWLTAMGTIYTDENLPLMKDYLKVRLMMGYADGLDREAHDTVTAISNAINGITGVEDDATVAYALTAALLPEVMDNLYIQAYCNEKTRDDITEIIRECVAYYREMLEGEDWLGEETRAAAIEKLDNMTIRAAYPDELKDYSDLTIIPGSEGGTIIDALCAITERARREARSRVNGTVDHTEWQYPASTVNAMYMPSENSINIFSGILGTGIYDVNAPREANLGGIGVIIGHEISHAFDTNGAQFDKNGVLRNWWTAEDFAAFEARTQKVIEYFNGIIPYEGSEPYNGEMVKTEAVADMGGMKCMLGIAAKDPDFDYDTFFRSWATVWATKRSPETEMQYSVMDVHPLAYLRINVTAQQFDEFVKTYGVAEGDGMYLAPEARITVR
ncbi:MAG: M13 family metallopeptidase [Clostridia bacterium]|nr:M13 family metallopeptidase [Clostridia bacterium]